MRKAIILLILISVPFLFSSCFTAIAIANAKQSRNEKKTNLRIVMNDNTVIAGNFKLPGITNKKVKIKTEDGQSMKINSMDIAYIYAWHRNSTEESSIKLVYTSTKQYKEGKKTDDNTVKYLGKERWLARIATTPFMTVYIEAEKYEVASNGNIIAINPGDYYYQKAGEDVPMQMHAYGPYFRGIAARYFADCPQLVEKIKNKEIKVDNYQQIMDEYAKCLE